VWNDRQPCQPTEEGEGVEGNGRRAVEPTIRNTIASPVVPEEMVVMVYTPAHKALDGSLGIR
jgi:hypothetical protein